VAALIEHASVRTHATLQYFCSPHRQDSALFSLDRPLERAAGFEHSDTSEAKFGKLERSLRETPACEDVWPLHELLSLPLCSRMPPMNIRRSARRKDGLRCSHPSSRGLGRSQPVCLILRTFHWIDPTRTTGSLGHSGDQQLPLLAIAHLSPEVQSSLAGHSQVKTLTLRAHPEDSATLVRQIDATPFASHDVVEAIVARSTALPLFLEMVTRAVLEAARRGCLAARKMVASPLRS